MKKSLPKQQTPKELTDTLLDFLRRKFYEGDNVAFAKDRKRLLAWVVLWPASWLNQRGVTFPAEQYRKRFFHVFLDAKAHGSEKITYRPAWLRMVIQSHFEKHGEEIYEQAKSIRSLAEHVLLSVGKLVGHANPDPTDTMAKAVSLIDTGKAKKPARKVPVKPPVTDQLTML